jgi:thiamine-monophosphate kinase
MADEKSVSGEDWLIERFFKPLARHPAALALTDDAAVYTPPAGHDLVITKDALVAGIHFFADDPADLIAQKSLRVNLSDLAAKGAKPVGFLLAFARPASADDATAKESWLELFARGLMRDIESFDCALLGGDTVRTPGPLTISITAFGVLPSGSAVKRSGAKVNDRVFVTGTIGDAAIGLRVRRAGNARAAERFLPDRYLLPQPRTALAEVLRAHASAAMDVSDGLAGDFAKLCRASGVSAKIDVSKVPLSDPAAALLKTDPALLETVMTGGDDYEIVCTVAPAKAESFAKAAAAAGVAVSDIGEISGGHEPPVFIDAKGAKLAFTRMSFSHF